MFTSVTIFVCNPENKFTKYSYGTINAVEYSSVTGCHPFSRCITETGNS